MGDSLITLEIIMIIGPKKQALKIKFGPKKPPFTIKGLKRIKDVSPIRQGTHIPVNTRDDLKEIVEEPCLKACQYLFDKNVETTESGCNGENCSDRAYIKIKYDTLDERNKQIADIMIANKIAQFIPKSDECIRHYFNELRIEVPTSPEETVASVEKKLSKITKFFVHQRKIIKQIDPQEVLRMHQRYQERQRR